MIGSDPGGFSVIEKTRDGCRLQIRALRQGDKAGMMAAVDRTSAQSLYKRFFGVKRHFSEKEIDFFLNIDFKNHVALVAVVEENQMPTIVGGCRYVVVQPGMAEAAFVVVDGYQGQSIGSLLLRHLTLLAIQAGLSELIAEVLPTNTAMLRIFEKCGVPASFRREGASVHVTLRLSEAAADKIKT